MKRRKTIVRTGIILVIAFPLVFIYLTISNSKDCDQIVIDTYEIYSRINIPKVDPINCYFDDEANCRISVYKLQTDLDLSPFELVDKKDGINSLCGKKMLEKNELPTADNLYLASGKRWGTKWIYLYEKQSDRLWSELIY